VLLYWWSVHNGNDIMPEQTSLPPHGRITCRKCFTTERDVEEIALWQAVNDPGAWGSDQPTVLVLGFSKGFTQADAYRSGNFEAIPFKKMRPRLTDALRRLGVLSSTEIIDTKFSAAESDFAFGSLVRCSLSRLNEKERKRECTGAVMPKAFTEPVRVMVRRCAETYLTNLPASLRLVIMLGSGDPYIEGCRNLVQSIYGAGFENINEVAYQTPGVVWIHIAHPSGMNGFFKPWMNGSQSDPSGNKLLMALKALSRLAPPILRDAA
jgi:hypothetical protein